jgi:hypothetical protein
VRDHDRRRALSVYSYISTLLTDRAGIAAGLVPLVLVGFGVGSLIGTIYRGRLGDVRPHATTIGVAPATTVVLMAISLLSAHAAPTVVLVAMLGLIGLNANPVLSALAVRFAGVAPTLGVAMSVSAYNLGTAVGSWAAGLTLGTLDRNSVRPAALRPDRDQEAARSRPPTTSDACGRTAHVTVSKSPLGHRCGARDPCLRCLGHRHLWLVVGSPVWRRGSSSGIARRRRLLAAGGLAGTRE